uniref:Uncharacterized protein n=1 Tax=Parascaris univalens TaxID=6257 RepID=A0A915ARJ3_PARUN
SCCRLRSSLFPPNSMSVLYLFVSHPHTVARHRDGVRGRFDEFKLHKRFKIKRPCSFYICCAHLVIIGLFVCPFVHFIHQRRCYLDAFRNFHFHCFCFLLSGVSFGAMFRCQHVEYCEWPR